MPTPVTTTRSRRWVRVLLVVLAVLVLLAILGWLGGRAWLARSVVPYEGERTVAGLAAPVEVLFDDLGVPHVWARTDADLFHALGWLHAGERLFQMELSRRMAHGTLAELFGAAAVETDALQRRLGFSRQGLEALDGLDADARARIDAYVAGVNAWIDGAPVLPPSFVALRHEPAPWTAHDVAALLAYNAWYNISLMDGTTAAATIARKLGDDVAALVGQHKPWSGTTVPAGSGPVSALLGHDPTPLQMTEASNTWVVAPARSASGAALHASDPHLAIDGLPGFWYLAALHSAEGTDFVGVTVPGLPAGAMGHNGHAAWSFTVAPVDIIDTYHERLHPDDTTRVRTAAGWQPLEVTWEEIGVAGEDAPRRVAVERSPRGVLVRKTDSTAVSAHWAGFDLFGTDALEAVLQLDGARDFDAFRRTAQRFQPYAINLMYSDRAGTIGYQVPVRVPRRTYDPFVRPMAWDTTARWEGYHDAGLSPWARDPARGWLVSTNNQAAPADWPVDVPGYYNLHRIERAEAWLRGRDVFDRAAMEAMQEDQTSALAVRWKGLAADAADRLGRADLADAFRAWDARIVPEDTLAALFTLWWRGLERHLFEDELGDDWAAGRFLKEPVLEDGRRDLIDDRRTAEPEDAAAIAARGLEEALHQAGGRTMGRLQAVRPRHVLARNATLDRLLDLSRGPYPRGGDSGTLDATWSRTDTTTMTLEATNGPSMRFVMDWAEPDSFTLQIPWGQSGNPFSPHFDSFTAVNERGERWVVPFTRQAVEARPHTMLTLSPE